MPKPSPKPSSISTQFLSPAEHDEKVIDMFGGTLMDTDDFQDDNFDSDKGVKQYNGVSKKNATTAQVNESVSIGINKLKDGTNIVVTREDAKFLNAMLETTESKKEMLESLYSGKAEFKSMLKFAKKNLNESLNSAGIAQLALGAAAKVTAMAIGGAVGGAYGVLKGSATGYKSVDIAIAKSIEGSNALRNDVKNRREVASSKYRKIRSAIIKESEHRGGHDSNYRSDVKPITGTLPTDPPKKDFIYTVDPKKVKGKMPSKAGDQFTVDLGHLRTATLCYVETNSETGSILAKASK